MDRPKVPQWNSPPETHVSEPTPLFIAFTRNWLILQQSAVSFITAGWPPEDIYVVENTGTMDAYKNRKLSLRNPFYINYYRLTELFSVNVLSTPTLLSFVQLQNFFLCTAISNRYPTYFWAHMDTVAISHEKDKPYRSVYNRFVEVMREPVSPKFGRRWAVRFFAYGRLSLVNTATFEDIGGWDAHIPF
jgi:hypothetical protein